MDGKSEIWVDVKGFEGFYLISNLGRVASVRKNNRILTTTILNSGYERIGLSKYGKTYSKTVHRISLLSFYGENKNKKYVNHIDGNKLNNRLDNLEWCTQSDNLKHSYKIGTHKKLTIGKHGKDHPRSIPVIQLSLKGKFIREFESAMDGCIETNTDNSDILKVCKGKRPTAGGYKWKFKNQKL